MGDSFALGLGPVLNRRFAGRPSVDARGMVNTGLAQANYPFLGFTNWIDRSDQLMRRPGARQYKAIVVCLGAVDNRALTFEDGSQPFGFGSAEFAQAYSERMLRLVQNLKRYNARVTWVGLPVAREAFYDTAYAWLEALGLHVASRGGFEYLPLRQATTAASGYDPNWFDGRRHAAPVRQPDGVHFNDNGNHLVTLKLQSNLEAALGRRLPQR